MKKIILTAGMLATITPMINTNVSFANNIEEVSSVNNIEEVSVEEQNTRASLTGRVTINSGARLNIRSKATTSSSIIGKINNGSTVNIVSKVNSSWYKVNHSGKTGYVSSKYISLTSSGQASSSSRGRVNTRNSNLNIRKSPSTRANISGKLAPGTVVDILSKESNGWYYINNNGKKGYVDGDYIAPVNSSSSNSSNSGSQSNSNIGKIATVNTNVLNLRSGASTNYSVISKMHRGNSVKIHSSNSNGWYKVELSSGVVGWCDGRYLTNFRNGSLDSSSSSNSQTQSQKAQAVINVAKSKLGCRYVWGAEGPNTFDCSGLTMYAYKNGAGINIPRVSRDQARAGRYVSKSNLQPGDLVFFDSNYGNTVNHVGIYIGDNKMIHSPKPGDVVKIQKINTNHYKKAYITARRFL